MDDGHRLTERHVRAPSAWRRLSFLSEFTRLLTAIISFLFSRSPDMNSGESTSLDEQVVNLCE